MIARVRSMVRAMPRQEQIALAIALALAALATVGQGVVFFSDADDAFDIGMFTMIALSSAAGIALAFEADIFPETLDQSENHRRALKLLSDMKQVLLVCAVELVLGEVLFLIALATGAPGLDGDVSVILAPVLIGVLGAGLFCLLGVLVGLLIAWPLVLLVRFVLGLREHKPASPVSVPLAAIFLTLVAMAILGTLGINAPDVAGTPTGRGLYDIIYLYTNYTGTPSQQVMAWIARVLGVVIVAEVVWIRRLNHVHGIGANMTIDPPTTPSGEAHRPSRTR